MMKNILLCLFAIALCACEDKNDSSAPIKIGTDSSSLTELTLHPQSRHDLLLSGGNHKYTVNVANSRLASASISQDTLKITSYQEQGSTFAIIHSHDQSARLEIRVIPNELNFTASEVTLAPTDINKTIRLGGGDVVSLTSTDPDEVIKATWQGNNGIIEIRGKAEGVATLTATSAGLAPKALRVKVRCIDEKGFLNQLGVYHNTSRSLSQAINPARIVKNPTTGTFFSGRANVNALNNWYYKVPPIERPVEGTHINLLIEYKRFGGVATRENLKFYVEEVRTATQEVVLRGKTLKIVVPYYN